MVLIILATAIACGKSEDTPTRTAPAVEVLTCPVGWKMVSYRSGNCTCETSGKSPLACKSEPAP